MWYEFLDDDFIFLMLRLIFDFIVLMFVELLLLLLMMVEEDLFIGGEVIDI